MFKKLTLRCVKTAWALFATSVVLLAVVISLLKISLPYANNYKADIETYLYQEFGAQVRIGAIGASWQKTGPVIVLEQISLTPSASAPLDISISETRVEWNFWQSLKEQRLVTGAFLLEGIRSRIDSNVLFKTREQTEGNELFESLSHLFLSQIQEFKIIDSFIIVDYEDGRAQDFQIDHLSWVNQGNRHQGQGEVFVDGFSNNSLAVVVDLYGQRRHDIFGQIYIEANQMDVTPWLQQLVGEHVALSETEANFSVWGDVQNGLVENILLDISRSGLRWNKQGQDKFLRVESAKVQWWKAQENWLLFGNNVKLESDEYLAEPFDFTYLDGEQESQFLLSNVELPTVTQLFSLFSATKELSILADSDFSGQVDQLQLHWGESLPLAGKVTVSDFAFLPKYEEKSAYAGVEGLQLSAYLLENDLWLKVRGEQGELSTADTFSEKITYDEFNVDTLIHWSENDISISVPTLEFVNSEVAANLAFEYTSLQQGHLSIYGEVTGPTAGNINKYLPQYLLGPNTYRYLSNAIQQGRGELTRILIDGVPSQLPFAPIQDRSLPSTFVVESKIRDGQFRFQQQWPALEELNATLTVNKSTMTIAAESGRFAQLPINNDVLATIQLAGARNPLVIDLEPEQMYLRDFHGLIDDTPLHNILGDVFDFVRLEGTANADIKLTIPLDYTPDENGQIPFVVASGAVETEDIQLTLPRLNLVFENTALKANFVNSTFDLQASNSELFGLPVGFSVDGQQGDIGYDLNSQLSANWGSEQLLQRFPIPIVEQIEGSSDITVDVNVNITSEDYQYFVNGNAGLTDLRYDITGPIKKSLGQYENLNVSVIGDNESNEIVAKVGSKVEFVGVLPSSTGRIDQASLQIGQEVGELPEIGFDLGFDLPEMEFESTLSFVLDLIESLPKGGEGEGFIDAPERVVGNTKRLSILGQTWDNVSVNAQSQEDGWLFSVGAKQTLSDIKVFNDVKKQGIEINSSFLNIITEDATAALSDEKRQDDQSPASPPENGPKPVKKAPEPTMTGSAQLIASLPPINLVCDVCTYNDKPLGKLQAKARAEGNVLLIEQFDFEHKRTKVTATGQWTGDENAGYTEFTGKLDSKNFGNWLKEWGLDSGIKDSDGKINLAVNWEAAPHEFSYERLNGTADFRLGEGYLSEISDQGARIFSLFSLDSLYRKLKFDFNDVFEKGLFYNDIKGDLVISNGVALSDNIRMDGVAGDMSMKGQTDLPNSQLDYNVSFKPKVTSSLPAIAAWFAPADGGLTLLAAIALDKFIENAPVFSEIKMKVSGDISKPSVQEVERFTRTVKLPDEVKKKKQQEKSTPPKVDVPNQGDSSEGI